MWREEGRKEEEEVAFPIKGAEKGEEEAAEMWPGRRQRTGCLSNADLFSVHFFVIFFGPPLLGQSGGRGIRVLLYVSVAVAVVAAAGSGRKCDSFRGIPLRRSASLHG